MTRGVSANFAPHFAPSAAPVAQWIERRFPKPQVACSIHAGGAVEAPAKQGISFVLQVSSVFTSLRRLPTMYGCVRHFAGQGRGRKGSVPINNGCYRGGWCVIPKPSSDGVMVGVSVNVWNAKRRFLERLALIRTVRLERCFVFIRSGGTQ
jgi:hypothetical protein